MGKKTGSLLAICLMITACLCMTGCANEIQNLSAEQIEEIGNYSAGILLKYDANSRSRLVSDEEIQKYDEKQARIEELKKQAEERQKQQEESQTEKDRAVDGVVSADTVYNELTDFYVLPDNVSISYDGYTVQQSYPENGENIYPVTSSDGKDLLVLHFTLNNQSAEDTFLDFFGYKASYKMVVNNRYTKGIFTTILLDDLATYIGNLPAGTSAHAVLITEMDKSTLESVDSLVLKIKNVSNEYTIKLK